MSIENNNLNNSIENNKNRAAQFSLAALCAFVLTQCVKPAGTTTPESITFQTEANPSLCRPAMDILNEPENFFDPKIKENQRVNPEVTKLINNILKSAFPNSTLKSPLEQVSNSVEYQSHNGIYVANLRGMDKRNRQVTITVFYNYDKKDPNKQNLQGITGIFYPNFQSNSEDNKKTTVDVKQITCLKNNSAINQINQIGHFISKGNIEDSATEKVVIDNLQSNTETDSIRVIRDKQSISGWSFQIFFNEPAVKSK
jgi:hypothetical protein